MVDGATLPGSGEMGVSLAALAVAALVLWALGAVWSPRRAARRRLGDADYSGHERHRALAAVGRRLSGGAVEPEDEALVGAGGLVAAGAAVSLGAVGGLLALLATAGAVASRRQARRRDRVLQVERNLPEVIDLLGLVVGAGKPTVSALSAICPRVAEPFRSELSGVVKRTAAGEPFAEAVRRLRESLGPSVSSVVYAVTAAEMDGAPLQPALQRAADEAHRRRRVRAEEAARRVPVLMLFPLVFCILPAFCLLTVVPLLVGTIADLQLAA